jgi:methionine-S-sulfoxide reductase
LRFCLNSESLLFTPKEELASLADPAAENIADSSPKHENSAGTPASAVLAGGCFWCTEASFEQLKGVSDVTSGYAGGKPDTANYERVCRGDTGHAEVIRVTYDPGVISYDQLLDVFFDAHDPTQLNRQGADMGTQYRSAIFYEDESQKRAAEQKIEQLTAAKKFGTPIVTKLEPLVEFYSAEAYHQDYARAHPEQPYIQHHALQQVCLIREKHPGLIQKS